MSFEKKIFVAGHDGLVGSAIMRELVRLGYNNLLTADFATLNLCSQAATNAFFEKEKPDWVFLAAAKVGGIGDQASYPVSYIMDNLSISQNVIQSAFNFGVTKLCNFASSAIYPIAAESPVREDALLAGPLETTNEPYAIAKIASIYLCNALSQQFGCEYFTLVPTNVYGPGSSFDTSSGLVIPSLISRFYDAKLGSVKSVKVWGDGTPLREFLYVDDLACAAVFLTENFSNNEIGNWINVGSGTEVSIKDLACAIRAQVFEYTNAPLTSIEWETSKPSGIRRKILDSSRLTKLGWRPRTSLREGIAATFAYFQEFFG